MGAKTKYKLSYTASEIDKRLGMIGQLAPEDIGAMPNIAVTSSDNGKFLCVVDGEWTPVAIDDAEELSY